MKEIVEVYTDGACRGNPGPGGWGVLLRYKGQEKTLSGGEMNTTNNRMELMAAIQGLNALKRPCHVVLFTDSEYVQKGISIWMKAWEKNAWRTSNNKPVKNKELWQELSLATSKHEIEWRWVKGHNGHPENERADELARLAIDKVLAKS